MCVQNQHTKISSSNRLCVSYTWNIAMVAQSKCARNHLHFDGTNGLDGFYFRKFQQQSLNQATANPQWFCYVQKEYGLLISIASILKWNSSASQIKCSKRTKCAMNATLHSREKKTTNKHTNTTCMPRFFIVLAATLHLENGFSWMLLCLFRIFPLKWQHRMCASERVSVRIRFMEILKRTWTLKCMLYIYIFAGASM